jgi:hypothetical protein
MPKPRFLWKLVAAATLYLFAMPSPAAAERVDDLAKAVTATAPAPRCAPHP